MDLRQYLQALRKFWWAVAFPIVLCGALGVATVARTDPTYRGSVTFFVRTTGDSNANGQFAGDQFAQRRVNSYVALLSTERMAKMVIDEANLDMDPGQVSRMIGATGDINTVLLTATVSADSEALAMRIADALAVQFSKLVDQVENSDKGAAAVNVEVVSGPSVGQVPTHPVQTVGVRAFLGLLIGLGFALILELRDTAVRSEEQLVALAAAPLLGRIPLDRHSADSPLVTDDEVFGPRAEAFRQLRTNLQFINIEHPVQVIVVTSSLPGEGKSVVSANLALAMAAAGQRVLAIEGDFRRPMLADYFGVERAVGLTDVLAGRVRVDDVLQPWGANGLVVLPSGQVPPNPSELLGSKAMSELLARFRAEFDMIIIDTPPLLPVTDAAVATTIADGAVVAVRYGRTTRQQVGGSVRSLQAVGASILGSVLTMTPNRTSGYTSYGYAPADVTHDGQSGPTVKVQPNATVRTSAPAWGADVTPQEGSEAGRRPPLMPTLDTPTPKKSEKIKNEPPPKRRKTDSGEDFSDRPSRLVAKHGRRAQ